MQENQNSTPGQNPEAPPAPENTPNGSATAETTNPVAELEKKLKEVQSIPNEHVQFNQGPRHPFSWLGSHH